MRRGGMQVEGDKDGLHVDMRHGSTILVPVGRIRLKTRTIRVVRSDLENDLGTHTGIGEDFQQNGMGNTAIDERHFFDTSLEGGHCAVHLRDHALVDDACAFEAVHLGGLKVRNNTSGVFGILQKAWHIAHENEALCAESSGCLAGGDVSVAIVNPAIHTPGRWADDRRSSFFDALQ